MFGRLKIVHMFEYNKDILQNYRVMFIYNFLAFIVYSQV